MTKPEDFQQQNKVVLDYHSKYKINIHYLSQVIKDNINSNKWDFPDIQGLRICTAGGMGSIPGTGAEVPHAVQLGQKRKNKPQQ